MADGKDSDYYKSMGGGSPTRGGFREFIYNERTGEFCGRTCMRWCKILLFYIVFYLCLTAFWTIMLVIFYQSLDVREPTYKLEGSRIGAVPGLGFRPDPPRKAVDSSLIVFTHGSTGEKSWSHWSTSLGNFLEPYNDTKKSRKNLVNCDFSDKNPPEKRVCDFPLEKIDANCTKDRNYGYDIGHPCVLIKLNNIFGWVPEAYDNDSFPKNMPEDIKKNYDGRYVYISCDGEYPADKENMGQIAYYPSNRIANYYYPFSNLEGYLSPFVMVHFIKPVQSVLINMECKAWAKNIEHDRMERKGSVHFELQVD